MSEISAVRAIALDANFLAHGLPATVTRPAPHDAPISTRVIWLTPNPTELPGPLVSRRQDAPRIAALRRDEVHAAPRGTLIEAPRLAGGSVLTWTVDGTDRVEDDHLRVIVVPSPGCECE